MRELDLRSPWGLGLVPEDDRDLWGPLGAVNLARCWPNGACLDCLRFFPFPVIPLQLQEDVECED